jgi:hypothetical protein
MKREGRLIEDSTATTNFAPPNFRTVLPLPVLLRGLADLLSGLYEPASFFRRAFLSLDRWRPEPALRPPEMGWAYDLRVLLRSIWVQGVLSEYRVAYWRFLSLVLRRWHRSPAKLWLGFNVLLSAHHFLNYARTVVEELEQECDALESAAAAPDSVPERKLAAAVSS